MIGRFLVTGRTKAAFAAKRRFLTMPTVEYHYDVTDDRCQAVLMVARGWRRRQVAEDLGACTVRRDDSGYSGIHRQGRGSNDPMGNGAATRRIPDELAPDIIAWIKGGSQSGGLDRANWTYAELALTYS